MTIARDVSSNIAIAYFYFFMWIIEGTDILCGVVIDSWYFSKELVDNISENGKDWVTRAKRR